MFHRHTEKLQQVSKAMDHSTYMDMQTTDGLSQEPTGDDIYQNSPLAIEEERQQASKRPTNSRPQLQQGVKKNKPAKGTHGQPKTVKTVGHESSEGTYSALEINQETPPEIYETQVVVDVELQQLPQAPPPPQQQQQTSPRSYQPSAPMQHQQTGPRQEQEELPPHSSSPYGAKTSPSAFAHEGQRGKLGRILHNKTYRLLFGIFAIMIGALMTSFVGGLIVSSIVSSSLDYKIQSLLPTQGYSTTTDLSPNANQTTTSNSTFATEPTTVPP